MVDAEIQRKCLEFIKSNKTAVIATISHTNQPVAATIYFTIDENMNFYFMTKKFTRKYHNIEYNHEIALVIGTADNPSTVQVQGRAEKIFKKAELDIRLEELKKIFPQSSFVAPLFQLVGDQNEVILYKIIPTWVRWLDLRDGELHNEYIQIIP